MSKGDDTRARILDEAMNQVSVRGMAGVSLGDLATGLGLSKSGVIKHFKTMEALQEALIESMHARFKTAIWDPAEPLAPGRARLDEIFERDLDWVDGESVAGGCPLTSTAMELDDQPGPLRDKLKAGQIRWARTLTREFQALRPGIDQATAATMGFQLKGIILAYGHSAACSTTKPPADRPAPPTRASSAPPDPPWRPTARSRPQARPESRGLSPPPISLGCASLPRA